MISKNGLLTTVGYAFPGEKPVYAIEGCSLTFLLMEGAIAVAGSAVKWARDQLRIINTADEVGVFASKVDGIHPKKLYSDLDTAGVVFVSAFSGLWAPYWRSDVQGTICTSPKNEN